MPVKVSDLAKEVGLKPAELIEELAKLHVEVKDARSSINPKIAALVRHKLGVKKPAKPAKEETKAKETKPKKAKEAKAKAPKKAVKAKEEKKTEAKKKAEPKKKAETKKKAEPKKKAEVKAKKPAKPKGKEAKEKKPEKLVKPVVVKKAEKKEAAPAEKEKPKEKKPQEKPKPAKEFYVFKKEIKPKKPKPKPVEKEGPAAVQAEEPIKTGELKKIQVHVPNNIRTLAARIDRKSNELIQYLMQKGIFANVNQDLEEDVVRNLLLHFGYELELPPSIEEELMAEHRETEKAETESRAPIVTFMGHVDHGKTSLLDYIRKTMVVKKEKGGITQHIGAYRVDTPSGSVTFLDTPGHEAFTAMRARGANITDVVVLVVAADDGVMPQTKEAIHHARAAGVPIVVAINKCDLPGADSDRVKRELQQEDLAPEKWGGKTVMVEVSAKTGEGVDGLVEMLMLESELLELKANPKLRARGVVVEAKKTPGQGVVATLLVKNGTLHLGDLILTGKYFGKVKAMISDRGERVKEVHPATPAEILGLEGVPEAGDEFFVVKDEKKAKTLSLLKQDEMRRRGMAGSQRVTLEDLHSRIEEGTIKELKIILKADVQGSIEALQHSLVDLGTKEVKVNIIHAGVGNINESDVMLAMVSNAVIIGFHVKVDVSADELAKGENVDINVYDVIYEAVDSVKAAMEGLLEPVEKEVFQGRAEVREIFPTKTGKVAGCAVTKGVIHRKDRIRVKRGQEIVHEGEINALRRFKDDVRDVREGFECGISIKNFANIRKNDVIEAYVIEKVARRLGK
ncbi:MAG: translation initiation factor IF-2 [Candidatus Omnitrophota bacterium]|jgi:translation initiation factor IF-2